MTPPRTPCARAVWCSAQVVQLERWLMEGAYGKVLDARSTAPSEYAAHFLDALASTVR